MSVVRALLLLVVVGSVAGCNGPDRALPYEGDCPAGDCGADLGPGVADLSPRDLLRPADLGAPDLACSPLGDLCLVTGAACACATQCCSLLCKGGICTYTEIFDLAAPLCGGGPGCRQIGCLCTAPDECCSLACALDDGGTPRCLPF
jgi:hypothetical protein